jgi:hypothetical protein
MARTRCLLYIYDCDELPSELQVDNLTSFHRLFEAGCFKVSSIIGIHIFILVSYRTHGCLIKPGCSVRDNKSTNPNLVPLCNV